MTIKYTRDNVAGHNHASSDYMFKIAYGSSTAARTFFNLYGNPNGHIIIEGLYMSSAQNNTLINLGNNDRLNLRYVDFKDIGNDADSLLATSLLDVPCDAYIKDVTFKNIAQSLKENVKKGTHNRGQGILHFADASGDIALDPVLKTQLLENVVFEQMSVNKQYSEIVGVSHKKLGSKFTVNRVLTTNSVIAGRGAFAFVEAPEYRGDVTITNSTFSNLHPTLNGGQSGYTGGALFFNEYDGQVTIENNHFENTGVKDTDMAYITSLKLFGM